MIRNFDKCERCRKSPATIECTECGTGSSRPLKFCYDCDKSYHQLFEKDAHSRRPIKFETTSASLVVSQAPAFYQSEKSPFKKLTSPLRSPMRRQFNDVSSKSPLRHDHGFEKTLRNEDLHQSKGFQGSHYASNPKFQTLNEREGDRMSLRNGSQFHGERLLSPREQRDQDDERHQYGKKSEITFSPKGSARLQYDSLSQSTRHLQGDDLTQYYQKMGEDYRHKYLELEKEHIFLKNSRDYELQRAQQQADEVERRCSEKLQFELTESERRMRDQLSQKDLQINILQKQLLDCEEKLHREEQTSVELRRLQNNLEQDYAHACKDFTKQLEERADKIERLTKDSEYQVSKLTRGAEQEKESLKRDYEALLQSVREEYAKCNGDLRQIIEVKNAETLGLSASLAELGEQAKREKHELQESMSKDKFTTDLYSTENQRLRQAKADFEQERTSLFNDLKQLEQENERMFGENKDLRKKVKKLEHILYGKK